MHIGVRVVDPGICAAGCCTNWEINPHSKKDIMQEYRCSGMKSTGTGNYTKERDEWLPENPDKVQERLLERQKKIKKSSEPAGVSADPVKITDYTKQRKQWLEKDPDKILADIKEHRKKKNPD